jgi:hypothetical protein
MGDYYRRDRYDGNEGRRHSRDDANRLSAYDDRGRDNRGREVRSQPPPRPRSRERYYDRDLDDYPYTSRDRPRDTWVENRDRYRDPQDRNDIPHAKAEESGQSPERRESGEVEPSQPPSGPRTDRQQPRGSHDDPYDSGKPNSQIIFRGLDKEITETDVPMISLYLEQSLMFHSCNNSSTRKTLQLNL